MKITWMANFNHFWVEKDDYLYRLSDRRHLSTTDELEVYDGGELWDIVGLYLAAN